MFSPFVVFSLQFVYIASKLECPQPLVHLPKENKHAVDVAIKLVHCRRNLFSNPVLDSVEEKFTVCQDVPNESDISVKSSGSSSLVDYDEAQVFGKAKELTLVYPLTKRLKRKCHLSRFLILKLRCPNDINYSRKAIFEGADPCDFTFVVYESQACFIKFSISFMAEEFKNYSLKDIKLKYLLVIAFYTLVVFIVGTLIVFSIFHLYTDCYKVKDPPTDASQTKTETPPPEDNEDKESQKEGDETHESKKKTDMLPPEDNEDKESQKERGETHNSEKNNVLELTHINTQQRRGDSTIIKNIINKAIFINQNTNTNIEEKTKNHVVTIPKKLSGIYLSENILEKICLDVIDYMIEIWIYGDLPKIMKYKRIIEALDERKKIFIKCAGFAANNLLLSKTSAE